MLKNAKGITLVELLLSLAISSIFLVLIWGFLIQGFQFSNVIEDKNSLQQEANYILKSITRFHQTSKTAYEITILSDSHFTFQNNVDSITFESPVYTYKIYTYNPENGSGVELTSGTIVNPNRTDLPIKIIIQEKESPSLQYELKTIISRIK